MKLLSLTSAALVAIQTTDAFTQPQHTFLSAPSSISRIILSPYPSSSSLHLNLPRLDLPDAITDKLETFDLKNPNKMDEAEYKGYSGAAIAGTLLFFLLPGAALSGIYDNIGEFAGAALFDFAFSALIGGGLAIYLSLRDDETGASLRQYGNQLLSAVGLPTLRYDLPSAVTDVMTKDPLNLMNPNTLTEEDYKGFSGAAVAGTLLFFLLPGAAITGALSNVGALGASIVKDFLFAAIIGGGAAIYLSLRDDEIGETVNDAGSFFLDKLDEIIEKSLKLLPAASSPSANGAAEEAVSTVSATTNEVVVASDEA